MSTFRMLVVASSLLAGTTLASAAKLASGETLGVKIKLKTADDELKRLWDRFGGWCTIAEWRPAVRSCSEGKAGDAIYRTLALIDHATLASSPMTISRWSSAPAS